VIRTRKFILYIGLLTALPLFYCLLNYGIHYSQGADEKDGTAGTAGNAYYVSNSGSDDNSGASANSPWRTLQKVNRFKLSPGDTVYFQKGGMWRGQLIPQSGDETAPVRYSAYGRGSDPQILGSVEKNKASDWTLSGKNIWSAGPFETDVGNVILEDGRYCGVKVWRESDLKKQNDFWFDRASGMLKLYSVKNPAQAYADIECALRRNIVDQSNKRYVVYNGLALKYGGAHGIYGVNTSFVSIRNCSISYIGGGDQYMDGRQIRFGNGVEFWNSAHDASVENCRIFEIYDAAVTNQGRGEDNSQYNITYKGNQIWNCEYSFEYWNAPEGSLTANILFEDNNCKNAGGGWGHGQRPDPAGRHLCFYENRARTESITIRNNVFDQAEEACIYIPVNWRDLGNLTLERNTYLQPTGQTFAIWQSKTFPADRFQSYKTYTGKDNDSVLKLTEARN
jgi:hypothetical protein